MAGRLTPRSDEPMTAREAAVIVVGFWGTVLLIGSGLAVGVAFALWRLW